MNVKQRKPRFQGARRTGVRPILFLRSLKMELSALIVIATAIAFLVCWILLKLDLSWWIAIDDSSHDEVEQLARSFNEMAAELQHADKMRMDMIANVSHELRTPVSALQAQVENMADGVTEPTPANLENILNQTHRLSDLIAFLLDLSRMEAGAASLDIERLNFAEFLDDTIEPLEIADGGHAHIIEMNVPDDIMIEGDQDRLRQLFTNILGNALKHSPDGTRIFRMALW